MQVKLTSDWTVKAVNGSNVIVPEGTMIDIPEAADEAHALEVALGAKIPIIVAPPAPAPEPEPEAAPEPAPEPAPEVKAKPTKAKPRAVKVVKKK